MRLWHVDLIPHLPRQQLLGQHRECAALRGRSWGKPHGTVNYVFEHPYGYLFWYHQDVMTEMTYRGYNVAPLWRDPEYRGKAIGYDRTDFTSPYGFPYPEHDTDYLAECLDNLASKGIRIEL